MLKDLIKEGGIYTIASFFTKGISLLLLPFYTSFFTTSDYGVIEILLVFGGLVNALVTFQLYQGVSRFLGEADLTVESKIKIASTGLFFVMFTYSIFSTFIILFDDFFINILSSDVNIGKDVFLLAIISTAINGVFYALGIQLRFLRKVKVFAITSFLHAILNIGFTILFVIFLESGLKGIYMASIVVTPIIILVQFYFLKDNLKIYFGRKELKKLWIFSYPLIPAALAYLVLNFTDRIFIKDILSFNELGLYGVASKFSSVITIVILGFSSALTPLVYNSHRAENTKIELKKIFYAYFSIGTITVLMLSIFSRETLYIFTQEPYYNAYEVMPIFYISMLITGLNMFSIGLHIKEKTKIIGVIVIISSLINVGLNYLLIPAYGLIGASFSTLLAILFNNLVIFYFGNRSYNLNIEFKRVIFMLPLLIISIYFGNYIIGSYFSNIWSIIFVKIIITLFYSGVLIKTGLLKLKRLSN